MTFQINMQFDDFESLWKNHREYCDKNFSPILSKAPHSTTVQSENKRKYRKKPLPDKLKYSKVKYACVHYGSYDSKSEGKRLSSTFKDECPAFVSYSVSTRFDKLYIHSMNLEHNHRTDSSMYQKYPQNRAFRCMDEESKTYFSELVSLGADNKKVLLKVIETEDKIDFPKSLHNFKAKVLKNKSDQGKNSAQKLLEKLNRDKENDPNMVVDVEYDEQTFELTFAYWQTGLMRESFQKYPEHVLCDATYCLNFCRMPLYIIMNVDGNNLSEIVALCLVKCETKDVIHKLFSAFKNNNPNTDKIETFMVDKDFTEINVIEKIFPHVTVEICLFHVLKAIKTKIHSLKMATSADRKAKKWVQSIAYSFTESEFQENVDSMFKDEELSREFLKYFQENWLNIKDKWVMCYRRQHFNLGDTTNNRLESLNQKIKAAVSKRNNSLDQFYDDMKGLCSYINLLHVQAKFTSLTKKVFHPVLKDAGLAQAAELIRQACVPNFAEQIINNMKNGMSEDSKCEPIDNSMNFLVTHKNRSNAISNGHTCSCSSYKMLGIPCIHIFCVRKHQKKIPFQIDMLSPRLSKQKWVQGLATENAVTQNVTVRSSKSRTCQQKFASLAPRAKRLLDVASACGEKTFQKKSNIIDILTTAWAEQEDIGIVIRGKIYDGELVTETKDVSREKDSQEGDENIGDGENQQQEKKRRKNFDKDEVDDTNSIDKARMNHSIRTESGMNEDDLDEGDSQDDKMDPSEGDLDKVDSNEGDSQDDKMDPSEGDLDKVDSNEGDLDELDSNECEMNESAMDEDHPNSKQIQEPRSIQDEDCLIRDIKPAPEETKSSLQDIIDLIKEPLKLKPRGRPKGIHQTVIGLNKVKGRKEQLKSPRTRLQNRMPRTEIIVAREPVSYLANIQYPKDQIWIKNPFQLSKTHEKNLLSHEDMSGDIVDAAQEILKNQHLNVTTGLISLHRFFKTKVPFIVNTVAEEGYMVQIYGIYEHYVCVSGYFSNGLAEMSLYDSLNGIRHIKEVISLLSAQFKNSTIEKIALKCMKVTQQSERECGAHAVANAVNACLNLNPGAYTYNMEGNIMRKHFHNCLRENKLTPFPYITVNNLSVTILHQGVYESVYCYCRKPDDGKKMYCCDVCHEWYHEACLKLKPKKGYEWRCEYKCTEKVLERLTFENE